MLYEPALPWERGEKSRAAVVIKLLSQLAKTRVEPDLYIVTPFVIVAERLRQLVRHSGLLDGWIVEKDGWNARYRRISGVRQKATFLICPVAWAGVWPLSPTGAEHNLLQAVTVALQ